MSVVDTVTDLIVPDLELEEGEFDSLAKELFQFQVETNQAFRRWVESKNVTVQTWKDVPLLPISTYKYAEVKSFDSSWDSEQTVFLSSGTTKQDRSKHFLRELDTYERSALAAFKQFVLRELPWTNRYRVVCLSPKLENSSLYHMMEMLVSELGDSSSFILNEFTHSSIRDLFASLRQSKAPVMLFGTSLALSELLSLKGSTEIVPLPPGSRVIETGGFKTQESEFTDPHKFSVNVANFFNVSLAEYFREYGMSELSSQFYGRLIDLFVSSKSRYPMFRSPSWARLKVVDPISGREVKHGEVGVIGVVDLANVWSCGFILTEDMGVQYGSRVALLGRVSGAPAKGCSITAEQALKVINSED